MTNRLALPVLAAAVALAGCKSHSGPQASEFLAGAQQSLAHGDLDTAGEWLTGAQAYLRSDRDQKEYALLAAEVDLRTGKPELAEPVVAKLLEDQSADPRVQELAGKTRFALADYTEASRHFEFARQRYQRGPDIERAADLAALSKGFEAYAEGRLAAAREQWAAIRDRELRDSVFSASGGTEALARSDRNTR